MTADKFVFDLQRFKGQTTSSEATYTPTEYELQLQQYAVRYAEALAPNAHELNDLAMGVLRRHLGFQYVTDGTDEYFINLNAEAQERATSALHNLIYTSPKENLDAANEANISLAGLAENYSSVAETAANNQSGLMPALNNKFSETNDSLNSIYDSLGTAANSTRECW